MQNLLKQDCPRKARKVVIVTTAHPVFSSRIFHKQAKTLVQAGYDVTLIAQHERDEVVDGIRIIALPKTRNRLSRIFGLTWRAFRLALRQRADIYHLHDPELLLIGVLLKLLTKGEVIYDVHEDYPRAILSRYWIPKPLRKPMASLFDILEKSLARRLDRVITATDHIKANFGRVNAVSVRNYPLGDDLPLKVDKRSGDRYVLVYAGNLSEEYGVKEMIQALEYLNDDLDVCLRLLGEFEDKDFEREVRKLPGFAKVRYLGWCNRDKVLKNLLEADIGLAYDHPVPRFKVAISTKLLEYMSAGLPVIAPDYPLWKEIVEGSECGIAVDPVNPAALAKAIEYLLKNPELRRRMGENGRRAFLKKYNWKIESKKLLDVYSELLGG